MSIGSSSVTLGGLLKHLAYMEDINFTGELLGGTCRRHGTRWTGAPSEGWEWRSAVDDTPDEAATHSGATPSSRSRSAVTGALADGGPGRQYQHCQREARRACVASSST